MYYVEYTYSNILFNDYNHGYSKLFNTFDKAINFINNKKDHYEWLRIVQLNYNKYKQFNDCYFNPFYNDFKENDIIKIFELK